MPVLRRKDFTEKPLMKFLLMLIGMALSITILILSIVTVTSIYKDNNSYTSAPKYLIWIFAAVGLMSIVFFLKMRTKINLFKCIVLLILNAVIGIMTYFATDNPMLFIVTAGIYCLTVIFSRILNILIRPTVRSVILNILIISSLILVGYGFFKDSFSSGTFDLEASVPTIITFECVVVAIVSVAEATEMVLSSLKLKVLAKVIASTFSLEILFGLLTMIAIFSFILTRVETVAATGEAWSYGDALWYCFAVVTTVGFGDIVANSQIGRILTVVLGVYGLIVVAVITSIIVNFYNETAGRRDSSELKQIKREEERNINQ